jgi:hypothetical protein
MIVEDVGFAFYFTYPPLCEVYFFNIECPLCAELCQTKASAAMTAVVLIDLILSAPSYKQCITKR